MDKLIVYDLSKKSVLVIFIYYIAILMGGIVVGSLTLININNIGKESLLQNTILASLATSGMFCSMQYIKKLYKACIDNRVTENVNGTKNIGNIIYFILRPVFSFAFVLFIIFAMLSGMIIITNEVDYVLNTRFLYLSVVISGISGYSIGKVLDRFTVISEEKIDKVSDSQRR